MGQSACASLPNTNHKPDMQKQYFVDDIPCHQLIERNMDRRIDLINGYIYEAQNLHSFHIVHF